MKKFTLQLVQRNRPYHPRMQRCAQCNDYADEVVERVLNTPQGLPLAKALPVCFEHKVKGDKPIATRAGLGETWLLV